MELTWLAEGYAPGLPAHLPPEVLDLDRGAYRRYPCPCCGHGGARFLAYHRDLEYKGMAVCTRCGNAQEV